MLKAGERRNNAPTQSNRKEADKRANYATGTKRKRRGTNGAERHREKAAPAECPAALRGNWLTERNDVFA